MRGDVYGIEGPFSMEGFIQRDFVSSYHLGSRAAKLILGRGEKKARGRRSSAESRLAAFFGPCCS